MQVAVLEAAKKFNAANHLLTHAADGKNVDAAHHLHGQMHNPEPWLGRFRWFRRLRAHHAWHHARPHENFGIATDLLDRACGDLRFWSKTVFGF